MNALLLTLVFLLLIAIVALLVVLLRRADPAEALRPRLDQMEQQLGRQFVANASDSAERVERLKGLLSGEMSDRIARGLSDVKDAVEGQLYIGRQEQDNRLGDTVSRLETKFELLSERQGRNLTDSRQELSGVLAQSTRTLEEKFAALESRLNASFETIRGKVDERLLAITERVQRKLDENIQAGMAQFERVQTHLRNAEEQLRNVGVVGSSINDLNNLLKLPHLRGRFGETTLERLLADFLPATMYELQATLPGDSRYRPDALIKFPERKLPIDSKFPRETVLALFETDDPVQLEQARQELRRVISDQARKVANYIRPQDGTTDAALLYLPSETLWFEVIRNRDLYEQLAKLRVFPVSPNTLLPALHAISLTFKWYQVAAGFEKSREELARAIKSFEFFENKFRDVGASLEKATEAYSTASGHLSRYRTRIAGLTGEAAPADSAFKADAPETPVATQPILGFKEPRALASGSPETSASD
ncbi:MAG: DNA recombination protein RmuC [Phycisphaerae bacterium]